MNRQACATSDYWGNFGRVTHAEAARLCMQRFNVSDGATWTILTRDEPTDDNPDPPVFQHRVTRTVQYVVKSLRDDECV